MLNGGFHSSAKVVSGPWLPVFGQLFSVYVDRFLEIAKLERDVPELGSGYSFGPGFAESACNWRLPDEACLPMQVQSAARLAVGAVSNLRWNGRAAASSFSIGGSR
jgi:hypothetical protein